MNSNIFTYFVTAVGCAVALMLTSCGADVLDAPVPGVGDGDGTTVERGSVHIAFRLAMNDRLAGPVLASRATGGDGTVWEPGTYDPSDIGDLYDNTLDPGSLRVVIVDRNGNLAGALTSLIYVRIPSETGETLLNEYYFEGTVTGTSATLVPGDYTIVVTANTPDYTTPDNNFFAISKTDWTYTWFSAADGSRNPTQSHIPMYGLLKVHLTMEPGKRQDIDTIHLLRSLAKVDVLLSGDEVSDFELVEVSIDRANSAGYVVPGGAEVTTTATTALNIDGTFRGGITPVASLPQSGLVEDGPAGIPFVMAEDNRLARIYIPEWDNLTATDDAATISVTVRDADGEMYTFTGSGDSRRGIAFKKYAEGAYPAGAPVGTGYNVIRNHYYRFEITGITTSGEDHLRFKVTIEDMEKGGDWTYEY